MRPISALLGLALLSSTGCHGGPSVESVEFAPASSTADGSMVRLYRNTLPRCPFEEVGLVTARGAPLAHLAAAIRTRALEMDGHAIVGLAQAEHTSPGQTQVTTSVPDSGSVVSVASFSVSQITVLSGTVIRFVEPHCRN